MRDGKPVAAVVPIEDLEALEAEDAYWSQAADEAIGEWEAAGRPAFRLRISPAIWASTWRRSRRRSLTWRIEVPSVGEGRICWLWIARYKRAFCAACIGSPPLPLCG